MALINIPLNDVIADLPYCFAFPPCNKLKIYRFVLFEPVIRLRSEISREMSVDTTTLLKDNVRLI